MALLYSLERGRRRRPGVRPLRGRPDGGFDFPDEMSDRLHRAHHRGRKAWETEIERDERLHGEDLARRRDPATLYDAVGEFSANLRQFAGMSPGAAAAEEIADLKRQLAELKAAGSDTAAAAKTVRAGKSVG